MRRRVARPAYWARLRRLRLRVFDWSSQESGEKEERDELLLQKFTIYY